MSLYGNLFRFRERANHRPLENFLTEALADLLNRMPRDITVSLVSELLLAGDESACEAWVTYIHSKKRLEWITQRSIGSGRLDILLEADGTATLIVENKIGASISERTKHCKTDVTDGDVTDKNEEPETFNGNQLMVYGEWLRDQRRNEHWDGALVLLTLQTLPPADFGRDDLKYGVKCQRVCNWRQLWQWLNKKQASDNGPVSSDKDQDNWSVFSNELMAFLEEENMNEKLLTQRDIAAMELYWPTWSIMEELIDRCNKAVKEQLKLTELKTGNIVSETHTENREYRSWFPLKPPSVPNKDNVYVMWGLHFPEESKWKTTISPSPVWPHVYVWVDTENEESLPDKLLKMIPNLDKPDGCHVTHDNEKSVIFASRSLHEFPTKVGKANENGIEIERIVDWVRERMREILPILSSALSS
jgi:hypothetical protein